MIVILEAPKVCATVCLLLSREEVEKRNVVTSYCGREFVDVNLGTDTSDRGVIPISVEEQVYKKGFMWIMSDKDDGHEHGVME